MSGQNRLLQVDGAQVPSFPCREEEEEALQGKEMQEAEEPDEKGEVEESKQMEGTGDKAEAEKGGNIGHAHGGGVKKVCCRFPRTREEQLAAIGLDAESRKLKGRSLYCLPEKGTNENLELWRACQPCFDPSSGDWEEIERPRPGEWLSHYSVKDQSFESFARSVRQVPTKSRSKLYLLPLCDPKDLKGPSFPRGSWPDSGVLWEAVAKFFAPMEVTMMKAIQMQKLVPKTSKREQDEDERRNRFGTQWNAGDICRALTDLVPEDAYAMLGLTMWDLYLEENDNFLYGLGWHSDRVGVFSFYRHKPCAGTDAWREATLLHRSIKTLFHEFGHTFGLPHCTWFNCLMRGSNGEAIEGDPPQPEHYSPLEHQRTHLHLCPVCLRKLHWSIGFDIRTRYSALLDLYARYENASEAFQRDCDFLRRRLAVLNASTLTSTALQPQSILPGSNVKVMKGFKSNSQKKVELAEGLEGVVKKIDGDGDALVDFRISRRGIGVEWVKKAKFRYLSAM